MKSAIKTMRAIGHVDDDMFEEAASKDKGARNANVRRPARAPRLRWAVPAAVCLAIAAAAAVSRLVKTPSSPDGGFLAGGGLEADAGGAPGGVAARPRDGLMMAGGGFNIYAIDEAPNVQSEASLAYLTEDEILRGYNGVETMRMDIFRGTVTDVQNLRIEFAGGVFGRGDEYYRALVTVKVGSVLRGDLAEGDEVTVLFQNAITKFAEESGYQTSTMGVAGQTAVGDEAIFNATLYNRESLLKSGDEIIPLAKVAQYGLPDDTRFVFLAKPDGVLYERDAFPSLTEAGSLDDVEAWLISKNVADMQTAFQSEGAEAGPSGPRPTPTPVDAGERDAAAPG
ncbi:MAG: hypothetical protein LBF64_02665 [Oscillospiraceae bacterium]|jgi:hypothetical protein|nr:hypothetical protein [Oscillospiraceae bacterium]